MGPAISPKPVFWHEFFILDCKNSLIWNRIYCNKFGHVVCPLDQLNRAAMTTRPITSGHSEISQCSWPHLIRRVQHLIDFYPARAWVMHPHAIFWKEASIHSKSVQFDSKCWPGPAVYLALPWQLNINICKSATIWYWDRYLRYFSAWRLNENIGVNNCSRHPSNARTPPFLTYSLIW